MPGDCKFCGYDKDVLWETKYWIVALHEKQTYRGRSYVICKRHCESVSDLTEQEWIDLAEVMKQFESSVKNAFGAVLCNWSCLMNHAYQEKPHNPHVHWHVRPRYEDDGDFGQHYERSSENAASAEVKAEILKQIGKQLEKYAC